MARCYSVCVRHRYPPVSPLTDLPDVWLISDARIDDQLEAAIDRLPPRSGMVFRHYHLPPAERRRRFRQLAVRLRRRGHLVVLAGPVMEARRWGADGAYGAPDRLAGGVGLLRLVTAHSLRELGRANRIRADAVLLSPVFATNTHPGASSLGPARFLLMANRSRAPVIALGGMSAPRARRLGTRRWAAIESLAQPRRRTFPIHS
jgi:thiamine-phosphate pyrophosphorylase